MVTKKREYSPGSRSQLVDKPIGAADAYSRESETGVVISVRCDRRISEMCANDSLFLGYSEGPFLLAKLHYKHLIFSCIALKLHLQLSYSEFLHKLSLAYESVSQKEDVIVNLVTRCTGQMDAIVETDSTECAYFEGLYEHKLIKRTQDERREGYEMKPQRFMEPELIFIDTAATLPCRATSFLLLNRSPYEEAEMRMEILRQKVKDKVVQEEPKIYNEYVDCFGEANIIPLMYNPLQMTMSAGEWVPAIFRDGRWYVPHISAGGRNDALRMYLLERGAIQESQIKIQGFRNGEDILLISAAKGIRRGQIFGNAPEAAYKYSRHSRMESKQVVDKGTKRSRDAAEAERTSLEIKKRTGVNGIPNTHVFRWK